MRDVPFLSEDVMNGYIYADNAATTKLDMDAFEAMKPFLLEEYGNPSQPYFFSKKAKMALKQARITIAECINAEPNEIIFTSGGTESDNWAIKNFGFPTDIRHIITSPIEHHAILNSCNYMNTYNYADVVYLPVDQYGVVSSNDLEKVFRSHDGQPIASCESTLVSIMFANNEIGTIEPIKELSEVAHQNGAWFHTDAVQAIGHVNIDVKKMGIDLLSASAHKFNGPKGIGFLYNGAGQLLYPHNDGGAQEFGLRAGTENVAAIVGMACALKKNCLQIEKTVDYLKKLEKQLIDRLNSSGLDYIRNGVNQLPGNISLSFADSEGEMLLHRLDLKKIFISTGSACDSVNTQVSHVLKSIGVSKRYANGTIRISFGRDNTIEEANAIADALINILKK